MTAQILPFPSALTVPAPEAPAATGITATADPAPLAQVPGGYIAGAIVCHTWGYEQTNANFYRIEKRDGLWLWLLPLGTRETPRGDPQDMRGEVVPVPPIAGGRLIRRKLRISRQGRGEIGFPMNANGSGWCDLWSGDPVRVSHYA